MADSLVRPRFPDRSTSRWGAWITLGVAVLGVLGGANAPARTGQAPADSEAAHVSELIEQFPNADRQSALVIASREDGGDLSDTDLEHLKGLLPMLNAQTATGSSGPMVSEDRKAAVLVTSITVGADNTETMDLARKNRSDCSSQSERLGLG